MHGNVPFPCDLYKSWCSARRHHSHLARASAKYDHPRINKMLSYTFTLALLLVGVSSQQNSASITLNSDGTHNMAAKIPVAGNDQNMLSLLGSKSSTGVVGKGLAFDNANGHGLSLTHTTIPKFGEQLTGAAKVNILNNPNHNLDANAFLTRNMPKEFPGAPNFNTYGGNLDYMYKNTVGANLGVAKTPFLQRTDMSAMGKLNLFHNPSTSLDLSAGVSRSMSPHFNTNWQPAGGLTLTKFW